MKIIDAKNIKFDLLNELIRNEKDDILIKNCLGQRFIGCGLSGKNVTIQGVPGNALGAYLSGSNITVEGNVQDAVGDTMDSGSIVVDGNAGDALGYAMRGGEIYVNGNAGYRVGIHMKAYMQKFPVMVIGGIAGSFLGEYQAGGYIIVLNKNNEKNIVGNFCGTGMHGGKIFLRTPDLPDKFPPQVKVSKATDEDLQCIIPYINNFCAKFGYDNNSFIHDDFYVLTPNSSNPYRQLYVEN